MKKLFLIATAIIINCQLSTVNYIRAEPVSPKRAATVAANFMQEQLGSKSPVALKQHTADWYYAGAYLFDREEGGWVLVAADDCVKPILGYSTTGVLDPRNMSPALRQWLGGYEQHVSAIFKARAAKQSIAVYPEDAAEWERLENLSADTVISKIKITNSKFTKTGVAPLITSHWNQQYPYDRLCPQNCVTGCAATALAMYMKFWNYPAFGNGSYNYIPPRTGTTESADFAHTLYDWANMPDSTDQYDTPEEILAVATLMYHCGVSLAMDYGTAASGGSAAIGIVGQPGYHSMDNALKDYFNYSPDMMACIKDYGYTNDSWRALLVAELNEGRPILYGGAASQGGHAFICDGYDSRQYMHFNFGWSGIGDGYYPVDSISPGVGGVGGNVTYTFNLQNSCLIGAVPDYALRVSDRLFNHMASGGSDSLLVGINEQNNAMLTISSTADWLSVEYDSIGRVGWVHFSVAPMVDGDERVAFIVCTQGDECDSVKVVQVNYNEEEMCQLTVVMENTNSHLTGWNDDAYLSLESTGGYVFGTAHLEGNNRDSVTVRVAPKDVRCVWHSGGGTDRYVNYWVRNQYDEDFVAVVNAYRNGGTHLIPWACAHLNIEDNFEIRNSKFEIYPNPAHDILNVRANGLQKVEIIDVSGRQIINFEIRNSNFECETRNSNFEIQLSTLPKGHYFVRFTTATGTSVRRFVKK